MKLIIDVDTGADDAMAILFAVAQCHSGTEILAITCVNGNIDLNNVSRNTLRTLQYADALHIPVFEGAFKPLLSQGNTEDAKNYFGNDGMGNAEWTDPVDTGMVQKENAIQTMIRLTKGNPGEITLVTLAPLTNVALALQLDETFSSNLKEVLIMGGNMEGKGNVSFSAEFNFHVDPEAAAIVLQDLKCPVTMVTWEACLNASISWSIMDELIVSSSSKNMEFFKKVSSNEFKHRDKWAKLGLDDFRSCDWIAMMVLFDSSVCLEYKEVYASVETQGRLTRGSVVIDWLNLQSEKPNVRLAMKLNKEKIFQIMKEFLS
ncbi:hypothetical protein LOTGIDRAFT_103620 [Lottia gigantea]|uniref:Inosine/uridine-preferring nucleoside hydrolase domain-containing protein n=1 Tax=Lottia gigantea TaxID=225164 RepID=V4A205_LOTGI|nr:hypothetical protein LOTGIDRAFT_103620 [Lottia gigantea]ESO97843.1 hypothetical protein LOTGIDRAFT_103620 [Lottia gigantea]